MSGICAGSTPHLGLDRRLVEDHPVPAPAGGGEDTHARAHQLEHVLVGGDQDQLDRQVAGALHHGAQHVIGLEAGHLQHGQAQGLEERLDVRDLAAEVVRRRGPRLLVGRELLLAEGRARRVPGHREVVRVSSRRSFHSMVDMPKTAWLGTPREVERNGSAW